MGGIRYCTATSEANLRNSSGMSCAPLAQRRHEDRHRAQPVVQVLAETPRGDGLLEVDVRGGDHADVGFLHLRRAHAHEFARLQHAQQAHLRRERQLGHLVQKNRPAVGLLEIALASFERTRERPLLVAEQLRIDRTFGEWLYLLCLRAVDGNIFPLKVCGPNRRGCPSAESGSLRGTTGGSFCRGRHAACCRRIGQLRGFCP